MNYDAEKYNDLLWERAESMFITLDGPDGTGKTSLAHALKNEIHNTVYTSEPTDGALGKEIRRILKSGTREEMKTLTSLFLEDRKEHLNQIVIPALKENKTVICDRYKYSTVCYQQIQGEDKNELIELNKDFLKPDYAFILLADDSSLLLERITDRGQDRDQFETRAILERTIDIYRQMSLYFPTENIIYLDASLPMENTVKIILDLLSENR